MITHNQLLICLNIQVSESKIIKKAHLVERKAFYYYKNEGIFINAHINFRNSIFPRFGTHHRERLTSLPFGADIPAADLRSV